MLPIPCFNALKIPKLVEALSQEGYKPAAGIAQVVIKTKTNPPTQEELMDLQRLVGRVMNTEA